MKVSRRIAPNRRPPFNARTTNNHTIASDCCLQQPRRDCGNHEAGQRVLGTPRVNFTLEAKMSTFDVAYFKRQGRTVVLVIVSPSFAAMPESEKEQACVALQTCASLAQLDGYVVPVWDDHSGRPQFWAPSEWHPFFESLIWQNVAENINGSLKCNW